MILTIPAIYRDGAFHPTSPTELPDGAAVQLTVVAEQPPGPVPSPQEVYRMLKTVADMPVEAPDGPTDVARNHDKYLYGGPGGAR